MSLSASDPYIEIFVQENPKDWTIFKDKNVFAGYELKEVTVSYISKKINPFAFGPVTYKIYM